MAILTVPRLHVLAIPEADSKTTIRLEFKPSVAYKHITLESLGIPQTKHSQEGMIEFLNQYNDENKLEGESRIRPSSPDIEAALLRKFGYEHACFHDQRVADDELYVPSLTDTQLRKPGRREYRIGTSKHPLWVRDLWRYSFGRKEWIQIAGGQKIPGSGVILEKDEATGLPTRTKENVDFSEERHHGIKEHWYFSEKGTSLAICRVGYTHLTDKGCIGMDAWHSPFCTTGFGFRPVSGPVSGYIFL